MSDNSTNNYCKSNTSLKAYKKVLKLTEEKYSLIIDAFSLSLLSPSYWIRVIILRIAATYTLISQKPIENGNNGTDAIEPVNIGMLCLSATLVKGNIETEREFVRFISKLEVIVRGGRLHSSSIKFVCSYCIGMLNFKFKPFWEPIINVLVAAVNLSEGEEVTWPLLLKVIQLLGNKSPTDMDNTNASDQVDISNFSSCVNALNTIDNGDIETSALVMKSNVFYFLTLASLSESQRMISVKIDARADSNTVYASVWEVFKKAPSITLRRSKMVVPIFLRLVDIFSM
jgi:hypothetical protein